MTLDFLLAVLFLVGVAGLLAYVGATPSLLRSPFLSLGSALSSQRGAVQPVMSASDWADKMLERVKGAGAAWERGIQNPSSSPTAGMKRAKGAWKNAMQAAITNDSWAKAVDKLSDEAIIAQAMKVGGGAFVAGITAREDKIRAAIQKLQPEIVALKAKLASMPIDTEGQREAVMLENLRGMRAIGKKLAGV